MVYNDISTLNFNDDFTVFITDKLLVKENQGNAHMTQWDQYGFS